MNELIEETKEQTLFDQQKESKAITKMIAEFKQEKDKVETRRKVRANRKNVDEERQKGTILPDETIIPDRTIDLNIRRSKIPYVAYVTSAKRTLIITDLDDPSRTLDTLELWFTRGMHYPSWKSPWLQLVDAVQTHGGAAMEVVYDPSKPFNCAIEYISRDKLIIPLKTKNLQACTRVPREYEITLLQLEEFAKTYGFNDVAVKKIQDKFTEKEDFIKIYRVLCKKQGVVYNLWYSEDCPDIWLREPRVHEIGLFNIDYNLINQLKLAGQWETGRAEIITSMELKEYPLFWFKFEETENEELLSVQGRVALDIHVQEALTHLVTNTVNATTRASHFYPSAESEPGNDGALKELGPLKPGIVVDRNITVFQPAWPNNIILAVMQALDVRKAQDAGHSDFASMARKDANKTATEMNLAAQEASEQAGIGLGVFASPFLEVYGLCFNIATHQALYDLCHPPSSPELLIGNFNLQAAGDVEVLKKMEDKQNAREFFEIVRGTPAAEKLLVFLLQTYFPDKADEWIAALNTADKDQLLVQFINILSTMPTDELTPEQRSGLQSLITAAQTVVGQPGNTTVPNQPS